MSIIPEGVYRSNSSSSSLVRPFIPNHAGNTNDHQEAFALTRDGDLIGGVARLSSVWSNPTENLSMTSIPDEVKSAVKAYMRRARHYGKNSQSVGRRPNQNTVYGLLIDVGLSEFLNDEDIDALLDTEETIHQLGTMVDIGFYQNVHRCLDSCEQYTVGGGKGRVNIKLEPGIMRQLHRRSTDLGIPKATLAVLCVLEALSRQKDTHRGIADLARTEIDKFNAAVKWRLELAQRLKNWMIEKVPSEPAS